MAKLRYWGGGKKKEKENPSRPKFPEQQLHARIEFWEEFYSLGNSNNRNDTRGGEYKSQRSILCSIARGKLVPFIRITPEDLLAL